MAGPLDRLIEDHRRDPDPHPRLSKQIQTQLDDVNARIDSLDGGGSALPAGAAMPKPVTEAAGGPGTELAYAREDHRHQLELPPGIAGVLGLDGVGVVMRDGDGNLEATTAPEVDALTIAGQGGVGQRLLSAFPNGSVLAVPEATWIPGQTVPATTIIAIAANQAGLSSVLLPGGWETRDAIPGKSLNCAVWSGAAWYADCTDGTVHRSLDGITWTLLPVTVSAAARVNALDNVVVVSDFLTGVKVSLDGGDTWASHTPYGGSPNTHNATCILPLGGGVYRITDGGQTGTGSASGIIATADTDAMPTPGSPWTVRYSGNSAAVFNVARGPSGLVSATTLPSGNIAVLTSADGAIWDIIDTGISSVAGRSVFYSAILSSYFIGATNVGATGSVITSADLVTFTETITGLGGPVDSFSEGGGKLFCGANSGGAWEITVSTKASVASGTIGYVGGDGAAVAEVSNPPTLQLGDDVVLQVKSQAGTGVRLVVAQADGTQDVIAEGTWDGTTLDLNANLRANQVRVDGQSGTGERVVIAGADGTQRDVDEIVWDPAQPRLRVSQAKPGTAVQFEVQNLDAKGWSEITARNQGAGFIQFTAYNDSKPGTIAGYPFAGTASFNCQGMSRWILGSFGVAAPLIFVVNSQEEAFIGTDGVLLRQRVQVTADAGTGQRLMSVAADGHHLPIAEATWAGGVLTLNGKLVLPPSVAASAYLNLGDGAAVTTLVNGDFWLSGSILHYRSAGTTYDVVPTARNVATQWSLTGGGSLASNRTLNLVNDLAVPPTDADYGTDSMRRRGWYKGNESLPMPAPFSPCRSSFGTFPTGPIAVPALNPQAAFAAFALGA